MTTDRQIRAVELDRSLRVRWWPGSIARMAVTALAAIVMVAIIRGPRGADASAYYTVTVTLAVILIATLIRWATGWVRADSRGVSWRHFGQVHSAPWTDIERVEVVSCQRLLQPRAAGVVALSTAAGATEVEPSVGCAISELVDFVDALTLVAPGAFGRASV